MASSQRSFHVLLSFKRNNSSEAFLDNLYIALAQAGLHTFRHCDKHGRGKGFFPEMNRAIKQAKVSIIVFSEDFAFSKWCLDELVSILERKKNGHMVLPVFYAVDPWHVRWQGGCFADAFLEYEKQIMAEENSERKREGINRVKRWRASLQDAANLAGIVVEHGHEFKRTEEIVEQTWIKLSFSFFNIAPYLVGVYSRIKKLCLWLQDGSNNLPISMIYGPAGIGKTTLAEILYQLHFEKFEVSTFVADTNEYGNLLHLQNHVLSEILKGRNIKVYDTDQGALKIKEALSCRKFLLVLDDVDQVDQLNAVLGLRDWFSAGSKIMITTRNESLLNPINNCFMYKAKKFDDRESLELFSWHAFQQKHPMKGFMDQSKNVVRHCQGLPLALQVLGSSLASATEDMWENTLQKLDGIFDIQKILELGYDNLHDDQERNLFLDIACFFVGKDKDYAVRILDECDFYTTAGIQSLVDKCLVKINEENKLVMHQSIKKMAKEVIRKESLGEVGKYSRIWDSDDGFSVLTEKSGGEFVEGLNLDLALGENKSEDRNGSNRHHFKDCHDNLLDNRNDNSSKRHWFRFFPVLGKNSSSTEPGLLSETNCLSADSFSRMHNLRLLQLSGVQLLGTYEGFPKKLKWLSWNKFQSSSLPRDFPIDHLVVLEMHNSNLQHIWDGNKILRSLKVLDLSHSCCLTRTPDFSGLPRLERLILEDCKNLVKIHESIGQLHRLILLNLRGCKNLTKLPKEIEQLKSLKNLILSGCLKLNFLVPSGNVDRKHSVLSLNRVLSSANSRRSTKPSSSMLQVLPPRLVSLDLSVCNLTEQGIPSDLSFLSSLLFLNLSENPIAKLPDSIKTLTSLLSLELFGCKQLELLPELPSSLRKLDARSCTSLKRITNLPNYMKSLDLQLADCEELIEVQTLFKIKPITEYDEILNLWGGIIDLKLTEGVQVEFFNNLTSTRRVAPVQVLYEFNIFSTFLPGTKVPEAFKKKSSEGPAWLNVPSFERRGLDICVVYKANATGECEVCKKHCITISNETKGISWVYSPVVFAHSISSESMLWLSRWSFLCDELEMGEQIMVSLDMSCDVKEFGIGFFEQVQNKEEIEGNGSFQHVFGSDWSEYQLNSDVYVLSHHS